MNETILTIFRNLIESGTMFLKGIGGSFIYEINGTRITLEMSSRTEENKFKTSEDIFTSSYYDVPIFDCSEECEYFTLRIKHKLYFVPKLSRKEQAYVMDKLDETVRIYEENILNSVENDLRIQLSPDAEF